MSPGNGEGRPAIHGPAPCNTDDTPTKGPAKSVSAASNRCRAIAAGVDRSKVEPQDGPLDVAAGLRRRRRAADRSTPYNTDGDRDPLDNVARGYRFVTLVNDRIGQFMFLRGGPQAREILATLGIESSWSSSGGWRVRRELRGDVYAAAEFLHIDVREVSTRRRDRAGGER